MALELAQQKDLAKYTGRKPVRIPNSGRTESDSDSDEEAHGGVGSVYLDAYFERAKEENSPLSPQNSATFA